MTRLLQTPTFKRAVKRLHKTQKQVLDDAIRAVAPDPECGDAKAGELAGVRVYKFRMNTTQILLAYEILASEHTIQLLALGSHENFYRDLKR